MPKIQLRQDISQNWSSKNPVLLLGEFGIETDTKKFKIGDGVTAWNSLEYSVPIKTSQLINDSGYINISAVPTMTSQLTNDSGFLTQHQDLSGKQDVLTAGENITITNNVISASVMSGGVNSVNGQTGNVVLNAANVGALPSNTFIPSKTSDLTNDSGFITIASVNNGTVTINQGGTEKGTFSLNQSGNIIIDLDAGGGSGGTVDQTYSPTSANAQSGVAINGAGFLQNKATDTSSLAIKGTILNNANHSTVVGCIAFTLLDYSTVLGAGSGTTYNGIYGTALGAYSEVQANSGIQLGYGTNSTANTLSVGFFNNSSTHYNWQLLDGTTGLIPSGRIPIDNSTITVNSNGQLVASGGGVSMTYDSTTETLTFA